jgi:RNA-splicing ligase RtcB
MWTMTGKYNKANIFADKIDEKTREQILGFLNCPIFKGGYIAIMPDCHAGKGSCIGFTWRSNCYIVPNIVGVDIGCGVLAIRFPKRKIHRPALDDFIHQNIPSGFKIHDKLQPEVKDQIPDLKETCHTIKYDYDRALRSLGTLGGGNHFIEVDESLDREEMLLVIHSGSRNFGLSVANFYQKAAKDQLEKFCVAEQFRGLEFFPPGDELGSQYYNSDMLVAQWFAHRNRIKIWERLKSFILGSDKEFRCIESVHNYIGGDGIVRKGAISAEDGEEVVIPLNMKDGVIIGIGKGNRAWNSSAPHGAGRVMSRTQARANLNPYKFQADMVNAGIYTTTADIKTIDEAPEAYKPSEEIISSLEPTVRITDRFVPIYNYKAAE